MKDETNNALKTLVLNTLIDMEDINDIECYEFKMCFNVGKKKIRVKGVVKIEIDDIEEVE